MIKLIGTSSLFHTNGMPTRPLKKLFNLLAVHITTLQEANDFAQKNLLRAGERWQPQTYVPVHKVIIENQQEIKELLHELGMIDEIKPEHTEYNYALFMGTTAQETDVRLDFLCSLLEEGIRFENLVLLTGRRQLRSEEKEKLPAYCETELDMTLARVKRYQALAPIQTVVIDSPFIYKTDGSSLRPTTESTLYAFAAANLKPGKCLVISNNPYIARQTKVAQRVLDEKTFPVEPAGAAACKQENIMILMDELARALYEETLYCYSIGLL